MEDEGPRRLEDRVVLRPAVVDHRHPDAGCLLEKEAGEATAGAIVVMANRIGALHGSGHQDDADELGHTSWRPMSFSRIRSDDRCGLTMPVAGRKNV